MGQSSGGTADERSRGGRDVLFERLVGRDCDYCEEGTLVRDTYKDNVALVCESCGTPTAQFR